MPLIPPYPTRDVKGLAASWTFAYVASVYAAAGIWIFKIAARLPSDRFWCLGLLGVFMLIAAVVAGFAPIFDPRLHMTESERLLEAARREGDEKAPSDPRTLPKRAKRQPKSSGRATRASPPEEDNLDA